MIGHAFLFVSCGDTKNHLCFFIIKMKTFYNRPTKRLLRCWNNYKKVT